MRAGAAPEAHPLQPRRLHLQKRSGFSTNILIRYHEAISQYNFAQCLVLVKIFSISYTLIYTYIFIVTAGSGVRFLGNTTRHANF